MSLLLFFRINFNSSNFWITGLAILFIILPISVSNSHKLAIPLLNASSASDSIFFLKFFEVTLTIQKNCHWMPNGLLSLNILIKFTFVPLLHSFFNRLYISHRYRIHSFELVLLLDAAHLWN